MIVGGQTEGRAQLSSTIMSRLTRALLLNSADTVFWLVLHRHWVNFPWMFLRCNISTLWWIIMMNFSIVSHNCHAAMLFPDGKPGKPPNLSATKQKKPRLVTEAEEKRWKKLFSQNLLMVSYLFSFRNSVISTEKMSEMSIKLSLSLSRKNQQNIAWQIRKKRTKVPTSFTVGLWSCHAITHDDPKEGLEGS